MKFEQKYTSKLFLPDNDVPNSGFLAYILPETTKVPADPIPLSDALTDANLMGSFVFCTESPDISSETKAQAFVDIIYHDIINPSTANRGMVWLTVPTGITPENSSMMGLSSDGSNSNTGLKSKIASGLEFDIDAGMQLSLVGEGSTVLNLGSTSVNSQISFSGSSAPDMGITTVGTINFSGQNRCSVLFSSAIKRNSLYTDLKWGFQYQFLQDSKIMSEWFPLASSSLPSATTEIKFSISINPSDPFNLSSSGITPLEQYNSRRTYFDMVGTDSDDKPVELVSFYRTVYGDTINLLPQVTTANNALPSRFVFSPGELTEGSLNNFHLSPEGEFLIKNGNKSDGKHVDMLCGLQGTEFFTVKPLDADKKGDKISFLSLQPAYSDKFPFQPTSPVAAPPVIDPVVLNDKYTTSWATIVKGTTQNTKYVAQPKGSALFGKDSKIDMGVYLYGHTTPGFELDSAKDILFPMPPYAGVTTAGGPTSFTAEQTQNFESQILSGLRRNIVAKGTISPPLKKANMGVNGNEIVSTSTPTGLIAELSGNPDNYSWDKVLLGQNGEYNMAFNNPDPKLLQALQTSDLFLVTANNDNLGGSDFKKHMMIEDWGIEANVGSDISITYNDYSNIMIIKGRKGALFVPASGEPNTPGYVAASGLVMNSNQWTNADTFSCPKGANKNTDELIILSQWIQNYFKQASEQDPSSPYFQKFNSIAKDKNWTGTIFLRTDIKDLPTNLTGIMAGVRYPSNFKAHHFAIEISPVSPGDNGPNLGTHPSSMFGLIYYEDKYFVNQTPVQPVTPTNSNPYDFCLLTLKVLFENTAVKKFESYAQLTLNKLYGSRVTGLGANASSSLNTVVLNGSLQMTNGQPVYAMGSSADSTLYLDNNILKKVEVTNIILTTLDDGATSGEILTEFGMSGYLDYNVISETVSSGNDEITEIFDVFSFGNLKGNDNNHQGLYYSNLGIDMSFTKKAMEQAESKNLQVKATYAFNSSEITFDIAKSTPRPKSFFLSMALDMESLVIGTPEADLKKLGYLQVLSDVRLGSVAGDVWYGLKFQMNMGTPGELAGKVGLISHFIVAWSPKSSAKDTAYKAQLGIMLPGTGGGAKLISLQSVMTLSIGQIKLVYNKKQEAFLLMLTEIALKFLGMLKVPPSGSTLFYLFGNPKGDGKSSGLGWYAQYSNPPKDDGSDSESTGSKLKRIE